MAREVKRAAEALGIAIHELPEFVAAAGQIDWKSLVRHSCLTMNSTATIRDLRNRFPEIRKRLESEGEVLVTERGKPRYRLTLYAPKKAAVPAVDYWERLKSYQPRPMTKAQARELHDENRGER